MKKSAIASMICVMPLLGACSAHGTSAPPDTVPALGVVTYGTVNVSGVNVAYREAGAATAPTIVLLHGFPASSHQYRNLIPLLADRFHVIAPDYPGFGESDSPTPTDYAYTFDNLARTMEGFLSAKGISKFALYVHDYGAPVGWRVALNNPEAITALFIQNGIAYSEGISDALAPLQAYWQDKVAGEAGARGFLTPGSTKSLYVTGTRDPAKLSPDTWTLDQAGLDRPGNDVLQLALFYDYQNNFAVFSQAQAFFRAKQPPTLIMWGEHDPLFLPAAAQAYSADLPGAQIDMLDAGHFALEDHVDDVATFMHQFADETPSLR
jgi:pimeloyl-ACP methyl ester carboxylesterase